jgi:biopolymer transport protein ExbB/TolQ
VFDKWRTSKKRAGCLSASAIPPSAPLGNESGAQEVVGALWAVARQHGDDLLARRIQKLITHFRSSRSPESVAETLNVESEAAYDELDSTYGMLRAFLWTIPVLGLIGTVTGIAGAVAGFASFLSAGAQELDDIKTALTRVTGDLAQAFDTTMIALALSVIVMIALTWIESREKGLLRQADDFCRDFLLPPMRSARAQAAAAAEDGFTRGAEVLRQAITDLRDSLTGFAQDSGNEWAAQISTANAEVSKGWTDELSGMRGELKTAAEQTASRDNALIELVRAAQQRIETALAGVEGATLSEALTGRTANVPMVAAATGASMPAVSGVAAPAPGVADAPAHGSAGGEGTTRAMAELARSLAVFDPFLEELAARLSRLATRPDDLLLRVGMDPRKAGPGR